MPAQVRNVTANRETQPTEVSFIGESNGVISRTGTSKNIETFSESGREYFSQAVLNYSELKNGTKDGILAFVENSQGTAWLPFSLGGTYYPSGLYVWDEPTQTWASSRTKVAEGIDAATGSSGVSSYNDLTDLPTIPTQITDAEITALGYVKTDNDTQLTDFDITALGYVKTDNNTQLSDTDISNFGYIKTFTDNNTQLSDSDIAAFGYVKTDNNTQLSDSDIANLGYIKTDNNTQLSDSDIAALGYVKTDNNTQLSDADITALGYIKTDDNTQLSQADIEAMGFSTVDNDTQLTDTDISNFGYIKTDNNTQLSDAEITALGYVKTTGTQISLFQVQDDGVTGQDVTSGYLNVQGLWDTPSVTNSDFSFDASLGHLTTNTAGIIEMDTQMLAYSTNNNRVQLMVEIQKNGTSLVSDSNYATRNLTQRTGSVSIHGFKDSCSIGDIYKIRVKRVGPEVTLGTIDAALGCYFSAKLYK